MTPPMLRKVMFHVVCREEDYDKLIDSFFAWYHGNGLELGIADGDDPASGDPFPAPEWWLNDHGIHEGEENEKPGEHNS